MVVRMCSMPREPQKANHDDDVNWEPRSQVNVTGTPEPDNGMDASDGGSILDRVGGGPTSRTVHNGEDVSEGVDRRKQAHQETCQGI